MTFAARTGEFANIVGTDINGALAFEVEYDDTRVLLRVVDTGLPMTVLPVQEDAEEESQPLVADVMDEGGTRDTTPDEREPETEGTVLEAKVPPMRPTPRKKF